MTRRFTLFGDSVHYISMASIRVSSFTFHIFFGGFVPFSKSNVYVSNASVTTPSVTPLLVSTSERSDNDFDFVRVPRNDMLFIFSFNCHYMCVVVCCCVIVIT